MTSSRIPLALAAAAALAAGCDRLATEPGHDFAVRVLTPTPIRAIGKITVPVRFAVDGCSAFDASVRGGDGASHPLEAARQADDTHLAEVPVAWLQQGSLECMADAQQPLSIRAQLAVSCRDAGRSETVELAVQYGTATRSDTQRMRFAGSAVQYLFPALDPIQPYSLAVSWQLGVAGVQPFDSLIGVAMQLDGRIFWQDPLYRPRLVSDGTVAFLSVGCTLMSGCPSVTTSEPLTVPGELIFGVGLDGPHSGQTWASIWVPAHILDLAFAADGSLIVLSEAYDTADHPGPAAIALTRVVYAADGTAEVRVIGYYQGETARTGFSRTQDGQLAFLSLVIPPDQTRSFPSILRTTDGLSVATRTDPTGALAIPSPWVWSSDRPAGSVQLAPDATSLVVNGHHLGTPAGAYLPLPAEHPYPGDGISGGAVWLPGAVALWGEGYGGPGDATGRAEVFDIVPPHGRRWGYDARSLPGSSATARILGATAVGDKLVLTTSTGVRILDRNGNLVGGADPLPCGLSPTALAIQSGPTTAAVGAGDHVYVFDLADLP